MKHLGDITKINGADIEPVECITFGSPCQDLSVAGKRAGLGGERSGLFMDAIRIIKEMREHDRSIGRADDALRPRYAVWENVPGAFSSNEGEDFRAVLEEFIRIKEPGFTLPRPLDKKGRLERWNKSGLICGDDWSIAWRIMDAQYWGVAQRRRRITIIMDTRGYSAGEILFEQESMSRDIAKVSKERKATSRNTEESTRSTDCFGIDGYNSCIGDKESTLGVNCGISTGRNGVLVSDNVRCGCDGGGKGALIQNEQSATLSTVQTQTLFS